MFRWYCCTSISSSFDILHENHTVRSNLLINIQTMAKKTLTILDGSWFVFRAYYGMPPLEDSQWRPVQAIFGFFRLLLVLLRQKPEYFVIAWDSPAQTLRSAGDEAYKANRIKLPDEFKYQMRSIKELVWLCNIPFLEVPWYEADDIIWTLARQQQKTLDRDVNIKVVSSDKDLKQLLKPWVVVRDDMKREETNEELFKIKHGFDPLLIVDYLALVGDSADNIKGVAGIGKKWAEKLIQTYGWLDDIYAHIDEMSWATKQKLIDGKEEAYRCKQMIALMEVPSCVDLALQQFDLSPDFDLLNTVLIDDWDFPKLQKAITELKNEYKGGTQLWLFG